MNQTYVVLFSGGIGSWASAKRIRQTHPDARVICLFTDTLIEDEDLYRFLPEAVDNVGGQLLTLTEGRDVWEVFFDNRMIGNTRADICSRVLKREPARNWIDEHYPDGAKVVVGIDWTEIHRYDRMRTRILCKKSPRCTHSKICPDHVSQRCEHCDLYDSPTDITKEHDHPWFPHTVLAPLSEPPLMDKADIFAWAEREGLEIPRLYTLGGFAHNNCGGRCVKQGHAAWANLLIKIPERYAEWEEKEQEFRDTFQKDVAILRDRRGGTTKPFTLAQLRERLACGDELTEAESLDYGGCGCMVDD